MSIDPHPHSFNSEFLISVTRRPTAASDDTHGQLIVPQSSTFRACPHASGLDAESTVCAQTQRASYCDLPVLQPGSGAPPEVH